MIKNSDIMESMAAICKAGNPESKDHRITDAERKRFHKILDDSIDKLNSPKNADKRHWKEISVHELTALQNGECLELVGAVTLQKSQNDIESECFDNINFPLFIIDNLRGNK